MHVANTIISIKPIEVETNVFSLILNEGEEKDSNKEKTLFVTHISLLTRFFFTLIKNLYSHWLVYTTDNHLVSTPTSLVGA